MATELASHSGLLRGLTGGLATTPPIGSSEGLSRLTTRTELTRWEPGRAPWVCMSALLRTGTVRKGNESGRENVTRERYARTLRENVTRERYARTLRENVTRVRLRAERHRGTFRRPRRPRGKIGGTFPQRGARARGLDVERTAARPSAWRRGGSSSSSSSKVPPFLSRRRNQRGIRRRDEPACPPPSLRDGRVPSGVKNPNTCSS